MDPAERLVLEVMALQKPMEEALARGNSEIQEFYRGSTVFMTGATGFLGKLLVEKLLRTCDVRRIYVLIREKKGKFENERLDEMLSDPVFDKLRQQMPDFEAKIYPIEGDVMNIKLGINNDDWSTIVEKVNIIFHVAATTRFDETLRKATLINIRGTREMVYLAKACKKLKCFTHISTAYATATRERVNCEVHEQFYPTPVPPEAMIQMAEHMEEDRLNNITPKLIEGWPNTYTFTKAIGEEVIRTFGKDLPVCVIRPPIVIGTYIEPTPGWADLSCAYGPTGIIIGSGLGLIRVFKIKPGVRFCIVPADYVNNTILIGAWDAIANKSNNSQEAKIYTISTIKCGCTFSMFGAIITNVVRRYYPTPMAIWYCYLFQVYNQTIFMILAWLLHYIPAYIVDGACYILGVQLPNNVPSLIKIYSKSLKLSDVLSFFQSNEWFFTDDNLQRAYSRLSEDDKAIYNVDVTTIDWKTMTVIWAIGIRKFIVKDGLRNTKYAIRKQFWLKIANYIVIMIYSYVLYKIVFGVFYIITSFY